MGVVEGPVLENCRLACTKKARVKRKSSPWINGDICIMMRARSYYHKKPKKSGRIEDWKAFNCVQNQLKSIIRKAKRECVEELSLESANNPKKAWQEVNRILGGKGRREVEILKTDGGVITSKQEMVEEFAQFFSSIVGVMGKRVWIQEMLSRKLRLNLHLDSKKLRKRMF